MPSDYWQRWNTLRASRRRFVGGGLATGAGVAGLALVGCGDDDDDTGGTTATGTAATGTAATSTGTTAAQPKKGGTFRQLLTGSPRSLDPHFDTFPANGAVTLKTNEGLLRFKPDFSAVEPELATAMPEQPDPLTFVFKVRKGVKFHNVAPVNGREMTAEDVKYSLERQMTDEAGKFQHAYFFLGAVDKIETPDAETVTFKMSKNYAPFISYVASPWTQVINRETVEKEGDLTQTAVGTGPFIFKEWQKDVKFELTANPDYWQKDKGLPYVDAVQILISTDLDTAATLLIEKKVDSHVAGNAQKGRILDARKNDTNYQSVPSQFWRQMRMQPTQKDKPYKAPFDDIRVREAIVRAVDDKQILDLVYNGDGIMTHGPILPIYPLWALKEPVVDFDVKKAKDLMAAAGSPKIAAPMIWATGSAQADQIGEILKQQLSAIGIDLELQPMETAAYYNQTYAYDYTFSHHVPLNNPDPDENLSSYFGRNSRFFKFYDEAIWKLIDKQAETLDQKERQAIVQDVQKQIVQKYPMKFMFTTNRHDFIDKRVHGWQYPVDLYDGRATSVWLDS
ncbi:MAG: ABC transporter substrate-binding protein [Dehalococcoidia bacterium]